MKVISVISAHPGSGQTTIVVNLASGLVRRGHRVLIVDPGDNEKLRLWLNLPPEHDLSSSADDFASRGKITIVNSPLGIDFMSWSNGGGYSEKIYDSITAEMNAYDYILLHPANDRDSHIIFSRMEVAVLICTDLKSDHELDDLKAFEKCWQDLGGQANPIALIAPNKINTKEWEHNTQRLFTLADYFGFEKIADPIPHCERVHDLPLDGRTVWELSQENLREAFLRLVETVENL